MRKSRLKFSLVLLVLGLLVTSGWTQSCTIKNEDGIQGSNIFVSTNEIADFYLEEWFAGSNLTYSVVPADLVKNISPIQNPLHPKVKDKNYVGEYEDIIDTSFYQKSNGDDIYSLLIVNTLEPVHQIQQFLVFGTGNDEEGIEFDFDNKYSIPDSANKSTQCLDVVELDEDRVIVDCLKAYSIEDGKIRYKDFLFIVNRKNISSPSILSFPDFTFEGLDTRKSEIYNYKNLIMVVQGNFKDEFRVEEDEYNQPYVCFYVYDPTQSPKYPQGSLEQKIPLQYSDFGFEEENFDPTDFDVFGDRVYVLVRSFGILSFKYDGSSIVKGSIVKKSFADLLIDQPEANAISITGHGAFIQVVIICREKLLVFRFLDIADQIYFTRTFDLPFVTLGTPMIQSNQRYIVIQAGQLLAVYDTADANSNQFHSVLRNVESFELLSSNLLHVYYPAFYSTYALQEPVLQYIGALLPNQPQQIEITAESRYFTQVKQCKLTLNRYVLKPDELGPREKTDKGIYTYEFNDELEKDILLNEQFAGPNLVYKIDFGKSQGESLQSNKDPLLSIDVPVEVEIELNPKIDEAEEIFSRVLQAFNSRQLQLRQLKNNSVIIHSCITYFESKELLNCTTAPVKFQLDSPILHFAYGEVDDNLYLGFVTANAKDSITFRDLNGVLAKFSFKESEIGDIKDFVIMNQLLYVLGSTNGVGLYKIFKEKIEKMIVIDQNYVADWTLANREPWEPNRINTHFSLKNLLFVELKKSTVVISIENDHLPVYINQIPGIETGYRGFLTPKTYSIIGYNDSTIREYSLNDLTDIEECNDFPKYNFTYYDDVSRGVIIGNFTHNLYVLGYAMLRGVEQPAILIYNTQTNNFEQLYSVITIPDLTAQQLRQAKSIQFSVDGRESLDFVLLNIDGIRTMFRIPVKPRLLVLPEDIYPKFQYSSSIDFSYRVIGMNEVVEEKQVTKKIVFINPQDTIYINEKELSASQFSEGIELTSQKEALIPLESYDWFNGPVLTKSLSCIDCLGDVSGKNLIRLKSRVQELSEAEVPPTKGIKKLSDPLAAFFYGETKHIHVLTDQLEIAEYSVSDYETRQITNLELNPYFDQCFEYIPCKNENKLSIDPDRLLYGVAICRGQEGFFASVVEYFTLNTPTQFKAKFGIPNAKDFLDAKCIDSKLFFLNADDKTKETTLQIYDLYNDITNKNANLTLLKIHSPKSLNVEPAQFTSFDAIKIQNSTSMKVLLSESAKYLVVLDLDTQTLEVSKVGQQQLLDKLNLEQELIDSLSFIKSNSPILNVKILRQYKSTDKSFLRIDALVVIEDSPIYQLQLVFQTDNTYFIQNEWLLTKVYQNYGDHKVLRRLSISDDYFAASYFLSEKKVYTVVVYSLLDDQRNVQRAPDIQKPQYEPIWGGREFEESYFDPSSPFVVYYRQELTTKNYGIFVPSGNYFEQTVIMEINDDDYLLVKPGLARSQRLTLILDSFFIDRNTPDLYGFIEPLAQFDVKPFCEILADLYETPSRLINSVNAREEYILRSAFNGFNLSYSLDASSTQKQDFILESTLKQTYSEAYETGAQKIIATDQIFETSGFSTVASLSVKRSQLASEYVIRIGAEEEFFFPKFLKSYTLEFREDLKCLDLEFVSSEQLVVYCVLEKKTVFKDKFLDYFYVINIPADNDIKGYEGLELLMNGTINSGKIMFYQDPADTSASYLVTGPLFDSRDPDTPAFEGYIRVYQLKGGVVVYKAYSTITGKDALGFSLTLADFDVLDNIIYLLDFNKGVFSFTFDYLSLNKNTSERVKVQNSFQNHVRGFEYNNGYGLDVDYDGAQLLIVIAELDQVLLFQQNRGNRAAQPSLRASYPSDVQLQNRPDIQLSNKFIGVRSGQILTIYRRNFRLSSVATLSDVQSFNLEISENLYTWGKNELNAYLLGEPFLWVNTVDSSKLSTDLNLTVSSTNNILGQQVNCTVRFSSLGIPKDSKDLYKTATESTVYSSDNPTRAKNIPIDEQIIGPNIKFSLPDTSSEEFEKVSAGSVKRHQALKPLGEEIIDTFSAEFDFPQFIQFDQSKIDAKQIIFSKLIAIDNQEFIKIHQLKDFTLLFQECANSYDEERFANCFNISTRKDLNSVITSVVTGLYGGLPVIALTQSSETSTIYKFSQVGNLIGKTQLTTQPIFSLLLNRQLLFFISNKSVYVIDTADQEKTRAIINQEYIQNWKIKDFDPKDFDPLEIEAHHSEGNILLIRLKTHVLVVSVESKAPRFVSAFTYDEQTEAGAVCQSHLLRDVFLTLCDKNFIETYSVLISTQPNRLNGFEKYGFTPYLKNFQYFVDYGNFSGFVYILASDAQNLTNLLIYRSHGPNIRTLYKALEVPSAQYNGSQTVQITATGYNRIDFVYILIGSSQYLVRVPHNQQLSVSPARYYPYNTYTKQYTSKFEAEGMNGGSPVKETITLQFYNPQTRLLEDEDAIDASGINRNDGLEMTKENGQAFQIPVDKFIYGPAISYTIECPDCPGGSESTSIITVQNRVTPVSSSFGVDIDIFKNIEGSFQNKRNKELYFLNNKKAYYVTRSAFTIVPPIVKLNVNEEAQCFSYIPCYTPNQQDDAEESLVYAVAICKDGTRWYAATVDYSTQIPLKLQALEIKGIQDFVQAQCYDESLLVLHTNPQTQESKIDVFEFFLAIQDLKDNKSAPLNPYRTYSSANLQLTNWTSKVLSGFEVSKTDSSLYRKLIISGKVDNFTTLEINSGDYTLKAVLPSQITIDVAQRLGNNKQYVPGKTVEIVAVKVLGYYNFSRAGNQTFDRFHTRVLVILKNLPLIEFLIDNPISRTASDLSFVSILGLYSHIGDTEVSRYVSATSQEFGIQYYAPKTDTLTVAIYKINSEADLDEEDELISTPIFGGYALKNIEFYDQQLPVPLLIYTREIQFLPREVKILIPYPQFYERPPVLVNLNEDIYVIALNSNFKTQEFQLIPQSIYARDSDRIVGIITPYGEDLVDIETEPYCRILNGKFEENFNLWNSINKTEQYLLEDFFEGYNLSYSFESLLDASVNYEVFDTLQEIDSNDFLAEEVLEIDDIAITENANEQASMIRFGLKSQRGNEFYSVSFFEGSEIFAPTYEGSLNISRRDSFKCYSVTYLNSKVGALFCTEFVDFKITSYVYREVFYLLYEGPDNKYTQKPQNIQINLTVTQQIYSGKTVSLRSPDNRNAYLISAPLLRPNNVYDETDGTYLSVYEYVQKPGELVGDLFTSRHSQVNAAELGLQSGLNIIDLEVFDNRIFILDYSQQIVSFAYNSDDGVTDVHSLSLVSFGFLEAWALHVKQQSAFTAMFIATNTELVHFVQPFGNYSGKAVVRERYPLEDELIVRPTIQSSGRYIAVKIDSVLTIYEKGQTDSQRVFRNIPKVQGYNLFLDNYLYVWQKHGVTSYLLEQAHMNVRALKEASIRFPVLTAISWNRFLNRNQTCKIQFSPKNIEASTTEARKVFKGDAEYFESDAEEEKNIFLDNHYIGPNLEYELKVMNGDYSDFEVDLAREINVNYPPEYIKDSVFDRIIQVSDNLQIQIHQVSQNNAVQMLSCKTSSRNILVMDCRLLRTLSEINSKITVYTKGWFREEPSFLIVQESEPTKVYQYLYTGILQFSGQIPDVSQIIDLELSQNTLYVLDKETIRREIRIYSTLLKDELRLISVIDDNYAAQWGIESRDFFPQYISTHYNHENILMIKLAKLLLAVSTQTSTPEYLTSLELDDSGPVYENFILTSNYLWDIRSDGISVHDLRDEKSFSKLYDLELYDYNFVVPDKTGFQFAVSNPSGFIYVVGEKLEAGKYYALLLVFRETAQNIKNLYTVIDTRIEYSKDKSYITISADGFVDVDFVQLNIDGVVSTIRVPHHPSLIYYPGPDFPLFGQSAEFTFEYAIFSMDQTQMPIEDSVKIIMINSHENIYLNLEEINKSDFSLGLEVLQRGEQAIALKSQKWYNGPVLAKRLRCELCEGEEPLIEIKNRVQEIKTEADLKNLTNATASFFYAETKHIHVLNYDNEVVQYSAETYEIRDQTKLGGVNGFDGTCFEYLPCKSNKIDLDPDRLLYGVAICESEGEWVAAVIEYFTLGRKAESRGIFHLKNATWYLDAKCMDSHLYFLDKGLESNETQLIIYDLYEGVKDNVHDLLVLKTLNSSEVYQGSANFTSFEIVKLFELNERKILMLSGNGTLIGFNFNSKTLDVTTYKLIQLSNKFNLHNKLKQAGQYIGEGLQFQNIRSVKYENISAGNVTQGIITALLVIESSPVYQIQIVYEKEDVYFQRPELQIKKVYQNYGSHEVQPRISFEKDAFFAVSYFAQKSRAFTVLVYALGESDQQFRSSSENAALEYQQILGGVQFTETPAMVNSPFVIFSTSDVVTGTKVHKLLVPADNTPQPTSITELNYDDYILVEEYLENSQQLVLELDNFFDQDTTVKIYGYLEASYNFDAAPYCKVLNDLYSTPSQLFNSNNTVEQYILRNSFSGFNLSYSLVHAVPTKQTFRWSLSPLNFWGEENINFKRQNVIGTSQLIGTSGASTFARLSMTRTQYGEQYYVWVAKQDEPLTVPRELSSFSLEDNINIRCLDLQLVTSEWLVVYCLELVNEDVDVVKYYDFFYVINTTKSSNPVTTFDGLEVVGTDQFFEHAKVSSYTDAKDKSVNYVVTAPLIESSDSELLSYIRIYEFRAGKLSSATFSTIKESDLGLKDLQLADFDILDDIIYILDHTQGVFSFTFDYQAKNGTAKSRSAIVNVFTNGQRGFRYQYGWALDVDYDGAQIIIVIAEQLRVLLFTQNRAIKTVPPIQRGAFQTDVQILTRPEVQISNRYIGLRLGQYLTIYRKDFFESSIATRKEVYSFNLEYQETLFIWNKEQLEMYNLEDPYLEIVSPETTTLSTDVNLTVTSTNSILNKVVNCTVRFFSFVVDKATTEVKNARTEDTVYASDNPARVKNIAIDQQIVGPNILFETLDMSKRPLGEDIEDYFDSEFDIPNFLKIDPSSRVNASDVIFSKVVSTYDSAFTKVHQFKNFSLQFQECQNIYDSLTTTQCRVVRTDSNLTSPIVESFFGVYGGLPRFGFVQSSKLDTLSLYNIAVPDYLAQQQFQGSTLSGLVLNKQLLFFISNRSVHVIDSADGSKTRAVIDKDYVKDWDLGSLKAADFDPLEVDAHPSEGNVILVRLRTHVILISVEFKEPRFISAFQYDEQDVSGAFCESHLVKDAFLTFCSKNFIETYSVLSLNEVEPLNKLEKYDYTPYEVQNRHLVSVSESSGLIYVLAADKSNNTVLLVYRPHTQNIRNLYKAIPLPSGQYNGSKVVQISATGSQFIDFVYFIIGDEEYLARVPHNQQLFVRPGRYYPYNGYTNQVIQKITATGMDGSSKQETIKLQFYNPQTRLLEDEAAIAESGINKNDGLEMESNDPQKFDLSIEKLQYGPVLSYDISCADCPDGFTKSNIIQVKNKIEDVTKSIGNRLNRFTEIEGAFQNSDNNLIYLLNDKQAHVVLKLNYDDDNIPVNLDVTDQADCLAYVPCYTPNIESGEKLEYTVAICEEGDHWVAAAANYSGTVPKKLPQIRLPQVQNFVQAQCMDQYLLVLTTDYSQQESKILVYNLYLDLQDQNQNATLIMVYDKKSLHFEGTENYVITAFEVFKTESPDIRRLFVTQKYNNFSTMGINSSQYHLIDIAPVELTADIASRMSLNKLYYPGDKVEIVSLKVLKYYSYGKTTQNGTQLRYHYRVLVLLNNLPSIELLVDCPPKAQPLNITRITLIGLYAHIGDTEISRHVSVSENEFALQFYSNEKDQIIAAVYKVNFGRVLDEDPDLLFTPIHCGYSLQEIGFYDHDSPVPILLYSEGLLKKTVRLFVPYPQFYEVEPKVFEIQDQFSIFVANSSFSTQYFELVPISIYARLDDKILGIITPFEAAQYVIETEPYCKILNPRWESRFNLWNSIDKTEQYLLDEFIEGYNLSFKFTALRDPNTDFTVFDTLQQVNTRDLNKEDVKDVIDIATSGELDERISMIRLGSSLYQYKTVYSLTFFSASEQKAPTFRGKIEFDGDANFECKSLAYATNSVGLLYCLQELSSSGQLKYREVFYFLEINQQGIVTKNEQNMTTTQAIDQKVLQAKTITLTSNKQTFIFSAPVVIQDQPEDEKAASFVSVYQYTENSTSKSLQTPLKSQLTKDDLGFDYPLNIADLQTLGSRVYILDYRQGIVSFEYNGTHLIDVQRKVLTGNGIRQAWGFLVKQQSAFISVFVSTDQFLFHFITPYGNSSAPLQLEEKYTLEAQVVGRPNIQSSGKYIAIQIRRILTIYERGRFKPQQVFRNIEGIQGYNLFVDNYLYLWQKRSVSSYLLEQPHMNVRAEDLGKGVLPSIQAISWNSYLNKNVTCTLQFSSNNIEANSIEARKLQDDSEPLLESNPKIVKNIYLDEHYLGPNLRYELTPNKIDREDPEMPASLDVPTEIKPEYPTTFVKDSSFSRIIQISQSVQIQIHQSKSSNSVQVLECNTTLKNITTVKCKLLATLPEIKSKIQVYSSGIFRLEPSFLLVQESEKSTIYQYHYNGSLHNKWVLESVSNVVDIELARDTMYVLDIGAQKSTIRIYSTLFVGKLQQISLIDDALAEQWGIPSEDFKPLNLIIHYSFLDLLFIKFDRILIAVSTQSATPELLDSRYIFDTLGPEANSFAVTANFLWNIRSNGISLYDLRDEKNFGILYDLELYNYTLIVPKSTGLLYSISKTSGFVYLIVRDTNDAKNHIQIMVIRETGQNIRNLYTVIDTNLTYQQDTSQIALSADGTTGIDFVLLNIDGNIFTVRVPHHPTLIVYPGKWFPKQGYSSSYTLNFTVKTMDGKQTPIQDKLEVVIVNPQTEVFVNEEAINQSPVKKENGGIKSSADENSLIPLDTNGWFVGPVLGLKLFCESACASERYPDRPLSIQNKVSIDSKYNSKLQSLSNVSGSVFSEADNALYILNSGNLTVTTRDFEILSQVILFQPSQTKHDVCFQLIPCYNANKNLDYVVAICEHGGDLLSYPVKITDKVKLQAIPALEINSNGGFVEAQCFNMDLFVLQKNQVGGTEINIYQFYTAILDGRSTLKKLGNLTQQFLTLRDNSLPITSFEVAALEGVEDHYKLFITQEKRWISILGLNENYKVRLLEDNEFDLVKNLKESKVFIDAASQIVNLKILNKYTSTIDDVTQFIFDTVVMIQNAPLAEISFTFEKNLTTDSFTIGYTHEVKKIFVQYGDLQILNHFTVVKNYFAVSYYSKKERVFSVVLYDKTAPLTADEQSVPVYHIRGGIQQEVYVTDGELPYAPFQLLVDSNNEAKIFSPHPDKDESPEVYAVNKEVGIFVKNNQFGSQEIQLEVDSVFADERQQVVGFINSRNQKKKSSNSNLAWILPISIIGGLLLFGGIGYFVWKKRKESLAANDDVSEGGYSLQEQSNQSTN